MSNYEPPTEDNDSLDSLLSLIYSDDDYEDTSVSYADFVREQYARADAEDIVELNAADTLPIADDEIPFARFDEGGE